MNFSRFKATVQMQNLSVDQWDNFTANDKNRINDHESLVIENIVFTFQELYQVRKLVVGHKYLKIKIKVPFYNLKYYFHLTPPSVYRATYILSFSGICEAPTWNIKHYSCYPLLLTFIPLTHAKCKWVRKRKDFGHQSFLNERCCPCLNEPNSRITTSWLHTDSQ